MKNFLKDLKSSFRALHWYEWLMAIVMIGIAAYAMISAFVNPTENGNPSEFSRRSSDGHFLMSELRICIIVAFFHFLKLFCFSAYYTKSSQKSGISLCNFL